MISLSSVLSLFNFFFKPKHSFVVGHLDQVNELFGIHYLVQQHVIWADKFWVVQLIIGLGQWVVQVRLIFGPGHAIA